MIDRETIQHILDASHIEEVVGEFVSLKKRGSNHIGCCPFHNEKTPSFYVSPAKGIYKCFGCGEAGDVVKFLMKHEHYTYPEALHWLADKYHIEIKEKELTPEEKSLQTERDGLFHVSEFAQKYFASLLYEDDMGRTIGLTYFHERGLSDEVIKKFGLGYCLDEWDAFTAYARQHGYSDTVLEKTGLTIFKEEDRTKCYDRFRGRVMFPIYSISGRVLGFSGRVLTSGKQAAKYVNSPDSDIYNKSRILYGLYQARTAITRADKCYLVEGNIDVISMHQSGVENTVASCGTSLTTEQIRLIRRYTSNVTVLYDGDSAGIKAALRAVDLLFAEGMHVRLVLFPDGEDPDSYAQKYGSTQLQEYLASHEDNFILFKTRVLLDSVKSDPIKKASLISDTAHSIALVTDLLERSEYIRQCAQLLHVSEDVLTSAVGKAIAQGLQKATETAPQPQPALPQEPSTAPSNAATPSDEPSTPPSFILPPIEEERHLIQLLLNYGNHPLNQVVDNSEDAPQETTLTVAQSIINDIRTNALVFTHPLCQRIFDQCASMLDKQGRVDSSLFSDTDDEQLRTFAISLMLDVYPIWSDSWKNKGIYVPSIEENLLKDVADSINRFKSRYIAQRITDLREELRTADPDHQVPLLFEIEQYSKLGHQLGAALGYVITPHYN